MIYPLLLLGVAYALLMNRGGSSGGSTNLWKRNFTESDFTKFKLGGIDVTSFTPEAWPTLASKLARIDGKALKPAMTNLFPVQGQGEGKASILNLTPGLPLLGSDVKVPLTGNALSALCFYCNELQTKFGANPVIFIRGSAIGQDAQWPGELIVLNRMPSDGDFLGGALTGGVIYAGDWFNLRSKKILTDAMCKGEA